MASKFWDNTRNRLNNLKKTQKWLANESKIGKTVINSGIARLSSPTVDNAYAIARIFKITIEELVDGEVGAEYVRQIVRPKLPPRIAAIVEDLMVLDDKELDIIQAAAHTAAEAKKGNATGANGLLG